MALTHEGAFLADICEHPDDDAPRLVYADWLDDHGQPERARLIRVQCEFAQLAELDDPASQERHRPGRCPSPGATALPGRAHDRRLTSRNPGPTLRLRQSVRPCYNDHPAALVTPKSITLTTGTPS